MTALAAGDVAPIAVVGVPLLVLTVQIQILTSQKAASPVVFLSAYRVLCMFHLHQAIFMIPTNPPPTFRKPELWSDDFTDFVKKCLVKSPEQRATATQLLQVSADAEVLLVATEC